MTVIDGSALVAKAREAEIAKREAPDQPPPDNRPVSEGAQAIKCWQRDIERQTRRLSDLSRSCAWVVEESLSKPPSLLRRQNLYGACLPQLIDDLTPDGQSQTVTEDTPKRRRPSPDIVRPADHSYRPAPEDRDQSYKTIHDLPREASPDLLDRYQPSVPGSLASSMTDDPYSPIGQLPVPPSHAHRTSPNMEYSREDVRNWQIGVMAAAQERLLRFLRGVGTDTERSQWRWSVEHYMRAILDAGDTTLAHHAASDGLRVTGQLLAHLAAARHDVTNQAASRTERHTATADALTRDTVDMGDYDAPATSRDRPSWQQAREDYEGRDGWGDEGRVPEVEPQTALPPLRPPTLESVLAQRGDESEGVPTNKLNTSQDGRHFDMDDEDDLHILASKVKRILDDEARRFGIDV